MPSPTPTPQPQAVAHTPTPWNLHRAYDGELLAVPSEEGRSAFVAASLVIAKGDKIIAEVKMQSGAEGGWPTVETDVELRANAALIVEAVNAHASLLAQAASASALAEALARIALGEGVFNRDQLTFANNVIERSKEIASAALEQHRLATR